MSVLKEMTVNSTRIKKKIIKLEQTQFLGKNYLSILTLLTTSVVEHHYLVRMTKLKSSGEEEELTLETRIKTNMTIKEIRFARVVPAL